MVVNSVLKVVSCGCVYLSKVHSSEEAHASVTSLFLKWCLVEFSEELRG